MDIILGYDGMRSRCCCVTEEAMVNIEICFSANIDIREGIRSIGEEVEREHDRAIG
jgi:hypothetical protein